MGAFFLSDAHICFFPPPGGGQTHDGVIRSDRPGTQAMCWENPEELSACGGGECSRSDR